MLPAPPQTWRNLHERLRSATRTLHHDLETAVDIDQQISSRARYVSHLVRTWQIHTAFEAALSRIDFSPLGLPPRPRRRSELIEADLVVLGAAPIIPNPIIELPEIDGVETGLGCSYVLEGSAAGARAILPAISTSLGLDAMTGASFFGDFRLDERAYWQACLKALNALGTYSPEADRAVKAAEETFAVFHTHLPRPNSGK